MSIEFYYDLQNARFSLKVLLRERSENLKPYDNFGDLDSKSERTTIGRNDTIGRHSVHTPTMSETVSSKSRPTLYERAQQTLATFGGYLSSKRPVTPEAIATEIVMTHSPSPRRMTTNNDSLFYKDTGNMVL